MGLGSTGLTRLVLVTNILADDEDACPQITCAYNNVVIYFKSTQKMLLHINLNNIAPTKAT